MFLDSDIMSITGLNWDANDSKNSKLVAVSALMRIFVCSSKVIRSLVIPDIMLLIVSVPNFWLRTFLVTMLLKLHFLLLLHFLILDDDRNHFENIYEEVHFLLLHELRENSNNSNFIDVKRDVGYVLNEQRGYVVVIETYPKKMIHQFHLVRVHTDGSFADDETAKVKHCGEVITDKSIVSRNRVTEKSVFNFFKVFFINHIIKW